MGRNTNCCPLAGVLVLQLCLFSAIVADLGCGRQSSPSTQPSASNTAVPSAASQSAAGSAAVAEDTSSAEPLSAGSSASVSNETSSQANVPAVTSGNFGGKPTSDASSNFAAVGQPATTQAAPRGEAARDAVRDDAPEEDSPPPMPTPELIAKWSVPEYPTLELLACYDGFGDSLLQGLALSPDGKQFVVGGARLTVWSLGEAKPRLDLLAKLSDDAIERPIRALAISRDGKWLASGDQRGTLRIVDMSDYTEVLTINAHKGRLVALAFSPDSLHLATTSYSGDVQIWHVPDGKAIKNIKASEREIARLQFLSHELLAIGGEDTSIWNITTGSRVSLLSTGYVTAPALDVSQDGRWLAFADSDGKVGLWDIQQQKPTVGVPLSGQGLCFSQDGKWLASHSMDSIVVWDVAQRQIVQVIDTTGSRTAELKWLPQGHLLLVAAVGGRVRLWGTPESAKAIGIEPMQLPIVADADPLSRKPLSSAQLQKVIDIRSFPRLPGAKSQLNHNNLVSYEAPATQPEVEQFYRYYLSRAGWTEMPLRETGYLGLTFNKLGCQLNITLTPAVTAELSAGGTTNPATATEGATVTHVSMNFVGNYDARWLPRHAAIDSKNSYGSFSTISYRTRADLTDLEVALLKELHAQGWTGYTRLNASSSEEPLTRRLSFLQAGTELTLSIGPPADAADELAVQAGLNVGNKSLPIPEDSGWIEFDSSTDLAMVANTKMDLAKTIEFYDAQMAAEGWLARDAGRVVKADQAWLPFIRGGQDVLLRLVTLPDHRTRIVVGDAERSSWQLQKPLQAESDQPKSGIEVADLALPAGAKDTSYDVDEKQIRFELEGTTPTVLTEKFVKQLTALGWKQERAGVQSEEYMFVTFSKDKLEVQLRARLVDAKNSSAIISGDGLLWTKPLPTPPVRISYETWLKRHRFDANLERLDQFSSEMKKIPSK